MSPKCLSAEERERIEIRIAAHEAGHCLYLWKCPRFVVTSVGYRIIEQTDHYHVAGVTSAGLVRPAKDLFESFDEVCADISGLAAEVTLLKKYLGEGLASDLGKARSRSEALIKRPGWPDLVYRSHWEFPGPARLDVTDCLKRRPEPAVRQLINAAYRRVRGQQRTQADSLRKLAAVIFLRKQIVENTIASVLGPQALCDGSHR